MADSNPYQGFADDLVVPDTAPKSENPYSGLADELKSEEQTALHASMAAGVQANPDRQAQILRLSDKMKLPSDFVDRNFDELKKHDDFTSNDPAKLLESHPKTSGWLSDPNNAGVAHDDLESLKKIEQAVQDKGTMSEMYEILKGGLAKMGSSISQIPSFINSASQTKFFGGDAVQAHPLLSPEFKKQHADFQKTVQHNLMNNPASTYLDEVVKEQRAKVPDLDKSALDHIEKGDYSRASKLIAKQFLFNAPNQAAIIGGMMVNPAIGLSFAGLTSAAEANKTALESGATPDMALANATAHGTTEMLFERLGTYGIMESWGKMLSKHYGKQVSRQLIKDAFKQMTYSVVGEGMEEAQTSIAQDLADYYSGVNPDALKNIGRKAVDAGLVGAFSGGALTAPASVAGHYAKKAENEQKSKQTKEFFLALAPTLEATKLRERMPEAQRALVESIVKDTPVENIYINPEDVDTYFQSKNLDPVQEMQKLGVLDRYEESKESGNAISIPLATFAHNFVGTEHYQGLADDVRFDPGDMSAREVKADREAAVKLVEQEAAAGKTEEAPPVEDTSAKVYESAKLQLLATGMPEAEAETNARVYEERARVRAERRGFGESAVELYDSRGLTIQTGDDNQAGPKTAGPIQIDLRSGEEGMLKALQTKDQGVQYRLQQEDRLFAIDEEINRAGGRAKAPTRMITERADVVQSLTMLTAIEGNLSESAAQGFNQNLPAQQSNVSPLGFYSQLETEIVKMDFKSIPTTDLIGRIKNIQGIKSAELEYTGILDWLQAIADAKTAPPKFAVVTKGPAGDERDLFIASSREEADRTVEQLREEHGHLEVRETDRSGKVSKEAVQKFLGDKGVKIQQVVKSKDFVNEEEDSDAHQDTEWGDQERQDATDDDINNEVESNLSDRHWVKERKDELRADYVEDFTDVDGEVDETGLDEKLDAVISDDAWESAKEYVNSDDWYGARFEVKDENTGWTLEGSDESGWYSEELGRTIEGDLEEVKVRLIPHMIAKGALSGQISDYVKADKLEWKKPTAANAPNAGAVTRRAKKLLKDNPEKYRKLGEEDNLYMREGRDVTKPLANDNTQEDWDKAVANDAERFARDDASDFYNDPAVERNTVEIKLDHDLLLATIIGNNHSGYKLTVFGEKSRARDGGSLAATRLEETLTAKTPEEAQVEAVKLLVEKGFASETKAKEDAEAAPVDPNAPSGRTKFHQYTSENGENYREFLLTVPNNNLSTEGFRGGHWAEDNVLVHLRTTDRTDDKGRKVLMVDEVQADWDQQGREKGYRGDKTEIEKLSIERNGIADKKEEIADSLKAELEGLNNLGFDRTGQALRAILDHDDFSTRWELSDRAKTLAEEYRALDNFLNEANTRLEAATDAVPPSPYRGSEAWVTLGLKRMIHLAVEQGYDAVAWMPAETHIDRWGTDNVTWAKKDNPTEGWEIGEFKVAGAGFAYEVVGRNQKRVSDGAFTTREAAQAFIDKESAPHFLVGSVEQRGGIADGTNIEEMARIRGELLERKGEKVASKEDLRKVIGETLRREREDRSLDSLTDQVWEEMQKSETGVKEPRAEGMKFFYDKLVPKTAQAILKKLDPKAKIEVGKFDLGNDLEAVREYTGPELTQADLSVLKSNQAGAPASRRIRDIQVAMQDEGLAFKDAVEQNADDDTAKVLGGTFAPMPKKTQDALTIPLTDALKEKAKEGFTFFQGEQAQPRGRIRFDLNRKAIIDLFQHKDHSTVLHETGHLWLEELIDDATTPGVPDQLRNDLDTVLTWMGVEARSTDGAVAIRKAIQVDHHEQWARGIEAYVMEGKSPSDSLRKIFAKFRVWLVAIYKSIGNLNVPLHDDVRQVMDRLLATDEEISRAYGEPSMQPIFKSAAAAGMNENQFAAYQSSMDEARMTARERLDTKVIEDFKREKEAFYQEKKAIIVERINMQTEKMRVYRAIEALQEGIKTADGSITGGEEFKLNKASLLKSFDKEFLKSLPKGIYTTKGGIEFNLAADMLGFESGEMMIKEIAAAEPKADYIERLATEEMEAKYPGLLQVGLSNEALKSIHNESRAKLLRMELEHLAQNNMPALKGVIKKVASRVPTEKAVREQAARIVGSRKIEDLKPHLFQRAEVKAANQAARLLTQGDIEGAFEAKRKELLNHELYRAAVEAEEQAEKSLKKFKKIVKADDDAAKVRDMDLVNTAKAILAVFGIGKPDKPPMAYVELIQQYDPDTYQSVEALITAATENAKPFYELTYDELINLTDTVDAIWSLAKSSREIEVGGRAIDREEVISELSTKLTDMAGSDAPGSRQAITTREKIKIGILSWRAALRRVESWAREMDNGERGSFTRFFIDPVKEATTNYRLGKRDTLEKFLKIIKPIEKSLTDKMIEAPELGYRFTKGELLGALLHTGNDSNFDKLIMGRNWGAIDAEGKVYRGQWDRFIARMQKEGILTKQDYDVLQGIWDLMEETKPAAQRAHKKMYGHYFAEITAAEFVTPFGVYRGGYVPAMADSNVSEDAQLRADRDALNQTGNSFMFPTTGRGFTKSRVHNYFAPLVMDMAMIPSQIDKVMRFIHIEPTVKVLNRVTLDKGFRTTMKAFDPAAGPKMLVPWLQRTAQQKVETPAQDQTGKLMDSLARFLRGRAGLLAMTYNFVNGLQNLAGIFPAASMVKPSKLAGSAFDVLKSPIESSESISKLSRFMEDRLTRNASEISGEVHDILTNPSAFEKGKAAAARYGFLWQKITQEMMDKIAWLGKYNQGIEAGLAEDEAVKEADAVVRLTQGDSTAEGVSDFETGTASRRIFTMFAGYFNGQANLIGTEASIARQMGLKDGATRLAYIYVTLIAAPAFVSALMSALLNGRMDDDDDGEVLDDLILMFFTSQARYVSAMIPVAGQLAQGVAGFFTKATYDDKISMSPAINMLERSAKGAVSVYKAIESGDGSKFKPKDAFTAVGLVTGIPTGLVARPMSYLQDVNQGKAKPANPADYARGLVTGSAGTAR